MSPTRSAAQPLLVLCGDWDDVDRCGVAHSERALLAGVTPPPTVVDPSVVPDAVRAIWRARRAHQPVLVVFPTRSTVARWRPLLSFVVAALLRHGDDLRLHLHEYRIFREVRWAIGLVLLLGGPTVVISSRSEGDQVRRSLAGRLGRVRPVQIPPFGSLPPSTTGALAVDAAGTGIVGVFGSPGPAKGTDLIVEVVQALPPHYTRLELVGTGWDDVRWPVDVSARIEVAPLGFVPSAAIGDVFQRWELAVAPFSDGASDGRSSVRIPLSHGIPTVTVAPDRPEDLTLAPSHLVIAGTDLPGAVSRATTLAGDRDARRRGAAEVDEFERRARRLLRAALLSTGADTHEPSTMVPHATG